MQLTPCTIWTKSKSEKGYGRVWYNGKLWLAHRLAYLKTFGMFDLTLCVLHKCDNPSCVNPDHLFLGTNNDNVQDRTRKNRSAHHWGELSGMKKLTLEQVTQIRSLSGTCRGIGKQFGISKAQVSKIKNNICWRQV